MTLFKENSNGENHIKNTKRASRSSNATKLLCYSEEATIFSL